MVFTRTYGYKMADWLWEHDELYCTIQIEIDLNYQMYDNDIFSTMRWCYENAHRINMIVPNSVIYIICRPNALDILKCWFGYRDRIPFVCVDLVDACTIGHEDDIISWVYEQYLLGVLPFTYTAASLTNAIMSGNMRSVKWWINHADEFELKYRDFTGTSNVPMLKFLLWEQSIIEIPILDDDLIDKLSLMGSIQALDFWYENRKLYQFKYSSNAIDRTLYIESLQWWFNHMDTLEFKYTANALDHCWSIDRLQWWFDHRNSLTLKYTCDAVDSALKANETVIAQWWALHSDVNEFKCTQSILKEFLDKRMGPIILKAFLKKIDS
jgi:hypothetical protein